MAEDLVYGSGMALLIGAPLLFVLTLPMTVFKNMFANELTGYWLTLGILVGYFVVMMVIWRLTGALRFRAGKD